MKLTENINRFTDVINKPDVEAQVNELQQLAAGKYTDLFVRMNDVFKDARWGSLVTKNVQQMFDKSNNQFKGNYVFVVGEAVKAIGVHTQILLELLAEIKQSTLARNALDYKTATIISYVENLTWYLEFARGLAIATYECEINALNKDPQVSAYIKNNLTQRNVANFILITATLLKHRKDLKKVIYDLPQLTVSEESETLVQSTEGRAKINALGLLDITAIFNPLRWIYAARRIYSDWKMANIQLLEKDLEYLELRHQELILARQDKKDARLEERIQNYNEAIATARHKLKKLEQDIKEG